GELTAADRDASETLSFSLQGSAAYTTLDGFDRSLATDYGKLYFDSASGAYRFVADAAAIDALADGASEEVVFTFQVTDAGGLTDPETLTLAIVGANDAAVLSDPADIDLADTSAEDTFPPVDGAL